MNPLPYWLLLTLASLVLSESGLSEDKRESNPASLLSMIASGKAKILSDDPAEITRLNYVSQQKKKEISALRAVAQNEKLLIEHFRKRVESPLLVQILKNGTLVSQGTLIDRSAGIVIAPFDRIESFSGPFTVQTTTKRLPATDSMLLSQADNLAIITIAPDPGSDSTFRSATEPQSTGAFVGSFDGQDNWVFGAISNELFQVPSRLAIDPLTEKAVRKHWKRIGFEGSSRRNGFPAVLGCDLPLSPRQCGSPVFNLSGELIGIAIARVDVHLTLVVPHFRIEELLKKKKVLPPK